MTCLLLIPTDLEMRLILPRLNGFDGVVDSPNGAGGRLAHCCGFGLVAAAARTSLLLGQLRPQRVVLAGIAGALDESLPLGSAHQFGRVAVDGIGFGQHSSSVGHSGTYLGAEQLGWLQWPGDERSPPIGDQLVLDARDMSAADVEGGLQLLSVCAASANQHEADTRRHRYRSAVAEDMEGFGVAAACRLAGVPVSILRGISNLAGQRDHAQWRIAPAIESLSVLLNRWLDDVTAE